MRWKQSRRCKAWAWDCPAAAYLIGATVFGLVGWAAWRHGRRTGRRGTLWLGVALMFYPYLVSGTWALYAVGLGLCAGLTWVHQRQE